MKVSDGFYHKWTIDHKKSKYIGTRDEHTGIRKSVSDKIYVYKKSQLIITCERRFYINPKKDIVEKFDSQNCINK